MRLTRSLNLDLSAKSLQKFPNIFTIEPLFILPTTLKRTIFQFELAIFNVMMKPKVLPYFVFAKLLLA